MLLRALAVALALMCAVPPAVSFEAVAALAQTPPPPVAAGPADLMHTIGLDRLFGQFGRSIAASPRQQGIADEEFLHAWEETAIEAFATEGLNQQLERELAENLDVAEIAGINAFLRSPFGAKVSALEQRAQSAPPEHHLGIIAKGKLLYWKISPTRRALFDELLSLSGAEMTFAMLSESIRAMAIGMHLAGSRGDIEVPWEEIDAGVQAKLMGLDQSLADASRATLAYTYEAMTDQELETYLDFLRSPATRKFYAVSTLAIGDIIRETMFGLGEALSLRLAKVNV